MEMIQSKSYSIFVQPEMIVQHHIYNEQVKDIANGY